MKKITVKTGFGYYVDPAGHKVSKAELPIGDHPLAGDLTYVEVANKEALEQIEVWTDPVETENRENEQKIRRKMRKMAIAALISEDALPAGYE